MSIPMALVDFVPVVCFLLAAILLQRDLYNKMSKGAFALFSAGTIVIFIAGSFKAIWKLLYAANICDFVVLNNTFFPMQTTGFVLAAAGLLAMLCHRQGKYALYSAAPVVYQSKIIFVVLLVLSVLVLDGGLIAISLRRRQRSAVACFVVSLVFVMGMGYLSTKDFSNPMMNWLGEAVNIVGQGTFLLGAWLLHAGGLGAANALKPLHQAAEP